jgi:hypothetical protein
VEQAGLIVRDLIGIVEPEHQRYDMVVADVLQRGG